MSNWQTLDAHLTGEYSVDYWSDDAIGYAIELVQKLGPEEWTQLASHWKERPGPWRRYLAEILAVVPSERSLPILLEMVQGDDEELVVRAVDSMRVLNPPDAPIRLTRDQIGRLRELAIRRPGIVARIIRDLIQRVQHDFEP